MKTKIVVNRDAVKELLQMEEAVAPSAHAIAASAGPGMTVEIEHGAARVRASVRTETFEAMRAEAEDRALTSAIDAGRR